MSHKYVAPLLASCLLSARKIMDIVPTLERRNDIS